MLLYQAALPLSSRTINFTVRLAAPLPRHEPPNHCRPGREPALGLGRDPRIDPRHDGRPDLVLRGQGLFALGRTLQELRTDYGRSGH